MEFENSPEIPEKKIGKSEKSFTQESKRVTLSFKQNRSFELHIRKTTYSFGPYGSMSVPESVLSTPEFEAVKDYFLMIPEA